MASLHTICRGRVNRTQDSSCSAEGGASTATSSPPAAPSKNLSATFTEIFPGVTLLASVNTAKNQCIVELVKPARDADRGRECAEPQQQPMPADYGIIPPKLAAAFRVPRVIQVIPDDEGIITTIEFVTERVGSASDASREGRKDVTGGSVVAAMRDKSSTQTKVRSPLANTAAEKRLRPSQALATFEEAAAANERPLRSGQQQQQLTTPPSTDNIFVHLFIGTSNGTVIVCNALSGTILVMAQFQYHHNFYAKSHGSSAGGSTSSSPTARQLRSVSGDDAAEAEETVQDASEVGPSPSSTARATNAGTDGALRSLPRQRQKRNESVVRFVVQERACEGQSWNPNITVPRAGAVGSSFVSSATHVTGVFVVHERGKVVYLGRNVLDTFISVVVNRQDGQRPCFVLEWSPTSTLSSFPIAGPAANIASMIDHVYTLTPVTQFSPNEMKTVPGGTAAAGSSLWGRASSLAVTDAETGAPSAQQSITDAAFVFTSAADEHQLDSVLKKTAAVGGVTDTLVVCGRLPAFALYPLEPQQPTFSASKVVKVVTSFVAGVAKSLWSRASDSTAKGAASSTPAPASDLPERLEEKPQKHRLALLEGDVALSRVLIDPTLQFAAFYAEGTVTVGAGRIYIADIQTGALWRVMKGYRSATFTWWLTSILDRPMLLLVVHLPQRGVVEVHSLRLRQRLAACYVPEGSVLLRNSAGDCASRAGSNRGGGLSVDCRHIFMLSPIGELLQLTLDLSGSYAKAGSLSDGSPRAGSWPLAQGVESRRAPSSYGGGPPNMQSRRERKGGVDAGILRSCSSPDDYFDLAMQLQLPRWTTWLRPQEEQVALRDNLDAVKKYRRQLSSVCEALKRRYAPSYTEPRVIQANPSSSATAPEVETVPRGLSAAQCLNYLQLRGIVVDAYTRLALAATAGKNHGNRDCVADDAAAAAAIAANDERETASSPAPLADSDTTDGPRRCPTDDQESWKHCLGCSHGFGKRFWDGALRRLTFLIGSSDTKPSGGKSGDSRSHFADDIATLKKLASTAWNPSSVVGSANGSASRDACSGLVSGDDEKRNDGNQGNREESDIAKGGSMGNVFADGRPLVNIEAFVSWFACGGNRVEFQREHVRQLEENTNCNMMGPFADLYYGTHGLNVFMKRLEVASVLGLDLTDLATLTLSWVSRQCAVSASDFFTTTSIGRLRFVLDTFPLDAFATALRHVLLPLGDITKQAIGNHPEARRQSTPFQEAQALAGSCHGLLLCCAVRLNRLNDEGGRDGEVGGGLATTLCQLVRLWKAALAAAESSAPGKQKPLNEQTALERAEALVAPWPPGQSSGACSSLSIEAFGLHLHSLLPVNAKAGDTLESYLLRRRVPLSAIAVATAAEPSMTDVSSQSCRSSALLSAILVRSGPEANVPVFPYHDLVAVLLAVGAEQYVGSGRPTSCFTTSYAWLDEHTWLPDRFQKDVMTPLEHAWSLVSQNACQPSVTNSLPQATATVAAKGRAAPALSWKAMQQCCVLVSAVAALQEVARPFTEAHFTFWASCAVPDVNLFSQVCSTENDRRLGKAPAKTSDMVAVLPAARGLNWLTGSRAHRDYLTSLSTLAGLSASICDDLLGNADEVRRVLLVQAIAAALSDDDEFVAPLVPRCLREKLKVLMQILGQQPAGIRAAVHRVQSFVNLVLFFSGVGSVMVDGCALSAEGLVNLKVPWATLFGPSLLESFQLYPSASLTTPASTPLKGSTAAGAGSGAFAGTFPIRSAVEEDKFSRAALRAASSLMREFLAKCVVPVIGGNALVPEADAAMEPQLLARLAHPDTKEVLARLGACLGLSDVVADLPALVVLDYEFKYACGSVSEGAARELLYVADRGLAARAAASDLRVLLGGYVKYHITMKRYYRERQDKARYDAAAQKMAEVLQLFSPRCKNWINRPDREGTGGVPGSSLSLAKDSCTPSNVQVAAGPLSYEVVGGTEWVTAAELDAMDRVVLSRLSLPATNPCRSNLFELLFLLAQLVNEGKAHLPADVVGFASELPGLVDNLRRQL